LSRSWIASQQRGGEAPLGADAAGGAAAWCAAPRRHEVAGAPSRHRRPPRVQFVGAAAGAARRGAEEVVLPESGSVGSE